MYAIHTITIVTLTIPLGPSVLFTKSPIATAPIKEDYTTTKLMVIDKHSLYEHNNSHILNLTRYRHTIRAVSAFSSSASCLNTLTGCNDALRMISNKLINHIHSITNIIISCYKILFAYSWNLNVSTAIQVLSKD